MKKRILSSLLMGALFVASMSTFTSCKDYDDDINNLQAQIDKAALASDVTTLKTTVDAAASNANSALTKAEAAATQAGANQTAIAAVKATADKAATDVATVIASAAKAQTTADASATAAAAAQKSADQAIKDAAAAQKDATSALTQLGTLEKTYVTSKALSSALDSVKANINAAVDTVAFNALKKQVASFKGSIDAIYSAITDVSLVGSISYGTNNQNIGTLTSDYELNFVTGTIGNTYTFAKADKDDQSKEWSATPQTTYTKGNTINFPSQIVIRVNPTNATPTADMIKLIDSKGNDLNNLIKVDSVSKFNTLLTRGTSETGLWTVSLELQKGIKAADVPQLSSGKHVLYAVAINNTLAKDSSRYAVSTYDLTVGTTTAYSPATSLDGVLIKSENSMSAAQPLSQCVNREGHTVGSTYKLIPATSGEKINVSFENVANVDRFYIVRDDSHGNESDASEINAWNSYKYSGLGEVVEVKGGTGKKDITVTIPSTAKSGDEVGFRIFAVNYDGTLADADKKGDAFYVYVGEDANATSVTGNFVANSATGSVSDWLPITGTLVNHDATTGATALPANVTFTVDGNSYTAAVTYAKDNAGTAASTYSDIKYVKFDFAGVDIKGWTDGKAATAQLISTTAKGLAENTINVNLTKILPDAAYTKKLMGYSWKDGQLIDGVYTAYLYPESVTGAKDNTWTSATTYGYKDLNQAINGLASAFNISIANATLKAKDGKYYYTDAMTATGTNWTINVPNAKDDANVVLIDNTTKHETTIGYNYGKVSSASNNNYIVNVETVQTVFACPLAKTVQTYAWEKYVVSGSGTTADPYVYGDVNVLTYNSNSTKVANILANLKGTNTFDNTIFGDVLSKVYSKYYTAISAKLISNKSGNEDYFTTTLSNTGGVESISFTSKSGLTNPAVDVPSTLVITLTDAYGHEMEYDMPFTVKRAQ